MDYRNFIESNKDRALNELIELLRIPSVSSDPAFNEDVRRCAVKVAEKLEQIGMEKTEIIETKGHPIIYSEWMGAGKNAKTVLVYGHYDVQPASIEDGWDSNPFEPVIKGTKIIARGTADDKGQVFCHIKAAEAHLQTSGKLPVNLKFIIEGEEEAGSNNLDEFIENNTDKLACDSVLISDTEWFADGLPSICYALRGISFIEVTVTGPNRDLHSGTFGGAVDNPANVLAWMIGRLKDAYGRITIPGFYDDVLDLTDAERAGFAELPYNEKEYMEDLDVKALYGENGYTTLERTWARPTLDINGIYGGYTGEGAKTIIPTKATAKISMRLVANQNPHDITQKAVNYIKSIAPKTVKVDVKELHGGDPVLVPRDGFAINCAVTAFEKAFGKRPVFMREGGSIPIVGLFQSALKAPVVLMGFGLPGDRIHSPNENYDLNNFYGGIHASAIYLEEFAK